MTTIAWDGKTLAVDSLLTVNDIIISTKAKKLFLNIGRYKAVAIAGDYSSMMDFVNWLKKEEGDSPKSEGHALCITEAGKCYAIYPGSGKSRIAIQGYGGGGCGLESALGSMNAGADAAKAVKIARKICIYTGGKIQSYTHQRGLNHEST